jgi:aminoglycoside phosphotransferase (APT) family kinase protein
VADTLRQLHRLTHGWQRPGWRSSTDLLHAETGTRIDLGAMPPDGVARCRAAWARFIGRETCVVHGDANPGNVRMTANRVALIDWDESHVDVPDLDLVLPHNAAVRVLNASRRPFTSALTQRVDQAGGAGRISAPMSATLTLRRSAAART